MGPPWATQITSLLFDWLAEEQRAAIIVTHSPVIARSVHRTLHLEGGRLHESNGSVPATNP